MAVSLIGCCCASATVIAQWNFNSSNPDSNLLSGTTAPSTGSGSISLIGGTTATFASGAASGGSSDPAPAADNSGYAVAGFPAITSANETAGIQVSVSTSGFSEISVSWDTRHSSASSRFAAIYYSLDGVSFTRLAVNSSNASPGVTPASGLPASTSGLFGASGTFSAFPDSLANAGDDWFNGRSVDFTSISGVSNNPNFSLRIVSSFDGGSDYKDSGSTTGPYTGGSWRFDSFTVNGVPEPTTALLGCFGLLGLLRRRR